MSDAPIRIAIRDEGATIRAYFAPAGTMDGAFEVASVSKGCAELPGVFDAFSAYCQTLARAALETTLGTKVLRVDVRNAPEHERRGHG